MTVDGFWAIYENIPRTSIWTCKKRTEVPYTRRSMKTQDGSLHVLSTSGNANTLYRKISNVQGKVWPSFPPQSDDWLVRKKVIPVCRMYTWTLLSDLETKRYREKANLSAFNHNSASKISKSQLSSAFSNHLNNLIIWLCLKMIGAQNALANTKKIWTKHSTIPLSTIFCLGEGKGKDSLRPMLSPRSSCYHPRSSAHLLHRQEFQNAPLHLLKAVVVLAHWEAGQGWSNIGVSRCKLLLLFCFFYINSASFHEGLKLDTRW